MNNTNNPYGVRVGQVWEDNDRRAGLPGERRRGKVVSMDETHARVEWYSNTATRVKLTRFRPNSTGYKLVGQVSS